MLQRIIGVLKLDASTFEEIEADQGAMGQAITVVAVVAVLGGLISGGINAALGNGSFLSSFLFQLIGAFVSWILWSVITFFVGTSLFGGKSDMGQMLRVLGFAQAPGLLGIIPVCGSFIGAIWTLAASFIAIRQGLDLDNTKAALTAVVAFIAVIIVSLIIGTIFGVGAAGLGTLGGALGQ